MNWREFYEKHQDKIELIRGDLGALVILWIFIHFNWASTDLNGIFNSQIETIINICVNGIANFCP